MKTVTDKFLVNITNVFEFVSEKQVRAQIQRAIDCNRALEDGTGKGSDYLGWVHLPTTVKYSDIIDIEETAIRLREDCQVVVVVAIGGSYLGAKAVIDALTNPFDVLSGKQPVVVYAGHNIGEDYLYELCDYLTDKEFGIINISKSGTTTEPALAFRVLRQLLERSIGKEVARNRIIAITDESRGALRKLAEEERYKTFVIPDNIGGRFSVFTPVGLLPIAVAGIDVKQLLSGAAAMEEATASTVSFEKNWAEIYAVTRNELYKSGRKIEILANTDPSLHYMAEWWKQLYGESEGKEHKGIFPASVDYTTDLHSMGQWIQDGERSIFETVISVENMRYSLNIPCDKLDLDGLNYIGNKSIDYVNKMAELGTQQAHVDGGVPNIQIKVPKLEAFYLGELLYFFERACGISGYMLGVNPFNQPGVEAYKKNMFKLLNKPGY